MKVTMSKAETKSVKSMSPGQAFILDGVPYMRCRRANGDGFKPCVRLFDGEIINIDGATEAEPVRAEVKVGRYKGDSKKTI